MKKRGQGLSMDTIVIAAIALLVLVILALIFTGKIGKTRVEMDKCDTQGGKCVATAVECSSEYQKVVSSYSCPDIDGQKQLCCVSIGGK